MSGIYIAIRGEGVSSFLRGDVKSVAPLSISGFGKDSFTTTVSQILVVGLKSTLGWKNRVKVKAEFR